MPLRRGRGKENGERGKGEEGEEGGQGRAGQAREYPTWTPTFFLFHENIANKPSEIPF